MRPRRLRPQAGRRRPQTNRGGRVKCFLLVAAVSLGLSPTASRGVVGQALAKPTGTCVAISRSGALRANLEKCLKQAMADVWSRRKATIQDGIAAAHTVLGSAQASNLTEMQGLALITIAEGYRRLTRFDSVLYYAGSAAALGKEHHMKEVHTTALATLTSAYAMLGRSDSALRLASELTSACAYPCSFAIPAFALVTRFLADTAREQLLLSLERNASEPFIRARVLDELGFYYSETRHQYDKALLYHMRADSLKAWDEWTAYGVGRAYRGIGIPDSAVHYFFLQLAASRAKGSAWAEAYALGNLGQICHHDLVPPRLFCAVAYYDSTATLAARLLNQIGSDDNRTLVAEFAAEIYEDLVFAVLALAPQIGVEAAARAGLASSEFGRALGLAHLLNTRKASDDSQSFRNVGGLPQRDSLAFLGSLDPTTATLSYLVGKDTLVTWLTVGNNRVMAFRQGIKRDSVASLVKAVREGLGVDYDFTDSQLRGRPSRAGHRQFSEEQAGRALRNASDALLPQELVQLVPPGADLVIVPQFTLGLLPFTVLPLPGVPKADLGSRYAIRYAPSLKVLEALKNMRLRRIHPTNRFPTTSLVVMDPRMPVVDLGEILEGQPEGALPLADLPSSLEEGHWVGARLKSVTLTGAEATETRVRAQMGRASVIHFATHAVAAEYTSLERGSFLATATDSLNDGLLTAGELLDGADMSLSATLVVLSACQTAVGPLRLVEGTMGLQRAFLARGAETVLASLWSVNDESTAQLMRHFYSHWLDDPDGPTKAEALQRAQADVRATPGFAHPLYWAGFQLIGLN
jgi:hypothetical protein